MPESAFVTYAQNCEDVLLWRALKRIDRGFYIDVGAQDPVVDSVTKGFYDRGWRGINVEPVPYWHARLVDQRPRDVNLCVAASDHEGELDLYESDDSGLSTSNAHFAAEAQARGWEFSRRRVPCTTLDAICAEHARSDVHFLKVDCEGAEDVALAGMPFDRVRPWVVLVESTRPNSDVPTHDRWEPHLIACGYEFVYRDGINRFYVARERADLRSAFGVPPNALDNFVHASELRARRLQVKLSQSQSELRGRLAEIARLQGEYRALTTEREARRGELGRLAGVARERETEIARLQQEYRSVTAERETALRAWQVAGRRHLVLTQRLGVAMNAAQGQAAEITRLQTEHRVHAQRRATLERELAGVYASRSWQMTAPLRWMREVASAPARSLRRLAFTCLRPLARGLRPLLRQLARHQMLRRLVVRCVGRDAHLTRVARLFLFGASRGTTPIDLAADPIDAGDCVRWSARERIALAALRRAVAVHAPRGRGA